MNDFALTLHTMSSPQLAMALVFIAGYGLALGALLGTRARLWSAGVAAGAAVGFVALADEPVPAFLLTVLALGLIALLIALAWCITSLAGLSPAATPAGGITPAQAAVSKWIATPRLLAPHPQSSGGRTVW